MKTHWHMPVEFAQEICFGFEEAQTREQLIAKVCENCKCSEEVANNLLNYLTFMVDTSNDIYSVEDVKFNTEVPFYCALEQKAGYFESAIYDGSLGINFVVRGIVTENGDVINAPDSKRYVNNLSDESLWEFSARKTDDHFSFFVKLAKKKVNLSGFFELPNTDRCYVDTLDMNTHEITGYVFAEDKAAALQKIVERFIILFNI